MSPRDSAGLTSTPSSRDNRMAAKDISCSYRRTTSIPPLSAGCSVPDRAASRTATQEAPMSSNSAAPERGCYRPTELPHLVDDRQQRRDASPLLLVRAGDTRYRNQPCPLPCLPIGHNLSLHPCQRVHMSEPIESRPANQTIDP